MLHSYPRLRELRPLSYLLYSSVSRCMKLSLSYSFSLFPVLFVSTVPLSYFLLIRACCFILSFPFWLSVVVRNSVLS